MKVRKTAKGNYKLTLDRMEALLVADACGEESKRMCPSGVPEGHTSATKPIQMALLDVLLK